jgi:repressor LexA
LSWREIIVPSDPVRRKRIKRGQRLAFRLTRQERDLIVERTLIDAEIERRLRNAALSGSDLIVDLTLDDVDDLAGHVAAEANHRSEARACRVLDALHDRLANLEDTFTDEDDRAADAVPNEAKPFTPKQGQYLAFIYYYTKIHGRPPAEADLQRYFRVTPPVVHQMIKALTARGFIDREPGAARSIRLRLSRAQLPDLE